MSALLNAWAWALIHFLWQGALVGLGTWLLLYLLRRATPQTRYAVACGALLLCLVLPMVSLVRGWTFAPNAVIQRMPLPRSQVELPLPELASDLNVVVPPSLALRAEAALGRHLPLIVLGWSLGSLLLALRLAMGLAWVRILGTRRAVEANAVWKIRLREMADHMGLRREMLLNVSDAITSPFTVGWWRPVILVPAALLAGMPPELLEALLAHELAHVKRHDYLVNLLQSAVEVLLFYHPAVWLISRRIRMEREHIADALAAKALGEPRRLALALQELDLLQLNLPNLAQAAHGGHLMARIRQLIQPSPRPLTWKTVVSLVGIASVCAALTARSLDTRSGLQEKVVPTPPAPVSLPESDPPPPPPPPSPVEPPEPPAPPEAKLSGPACALVRKDDKDIRFSGSSGDLQEIRALQKKAKRDFFWFREGEKTYTVDEPAFVARVAKQRKPLDDLERKRGEVSKKMEAQSKRLGELGTKLGMEAAKQVPLNDMLSELNKQLTPFIAQITTYAAQMAPLAARMASPDLPETERTALEKQLEEINQKMEAAGKQMEAIKEPMEAKGKEMEKHSKPIEELGKQMEDAAKPLEALGEQLETLTKEEERLRPGILKAMQDAIPEALASGKAKPVQASK